MDVWKEWKKNRYTRKYTWNCNVEEENQYEDPEKDGQSNCVKKNLEGRNLLLEKVNERRLYEGRKDWRSLITRPMTDTLYHLPGV